MDLFVTCECKHKTSVTAAKCGEDVSCLCGNSIRVPALRVLRAQSLDALACNESQTSKKSQDFGAWIRMFLTCLAVAVGSLTAPIAYLVVEEIPSTVRWWILHSMIVVLMVYFYDRKKSSTKPSTFPPSSLPQSLFVGLIFLLFMAAIDILISTLIYAMSNTPESLTATRMLGEEVAIRVLKLFPNWVALLFAMRCVLRKIGIEELRKRSLRITVASVVSVTLMQVINIAIVLLTSPLVR